MQRLGRRGGAALACALVVMVVACGGSSSSSSGSDGEGGDETSGNGTTASTADGTTGDGSSTEGTGGSGTSGSGTTATGLVEGEPIALEDYPDAIASLLCEWITPCCSETGLPVVESECLTVMSQVFGEDVVNADPANYTYDPALAGDCVAAGRGFYAQLGCDLGAADPEEGDALDAQCERIFTGKLAPGAVCTSNIECAAAEGEDSSCDDSIFSDSPRCVVEWRAKQGDDCYWTCTEGADQSTSCSGGASDVPDRQGQCFTNDGLYCADGVCVASSELGEPCTSGEQCAEGYCSASTQECTAAGPEDAPCAADDQCQVGLHCDGLVCVPLTDAGDTGAPCVDSSDCASGSCADGACDDSFAGSSTVAILCLAASGQP